MSARSGATAGAASVDTVGHLADVTSNVLQAVALPPRPAGPGGGGAAAAPDAAAAAEAEERAQKQGKQVGRGARGTTGRLRHPAP